MRAARSPSERAVDFSTQQFGPGKLAENVGLCVLEPLSVLCKRNFLPCQLPCFVPLQPPYDAGRDKDYRCSGQHGPTCDPLETCGACLCVRGASLRRLDRSDPRLIAREGLLPLLALGLLAD